MKLNKKTSPFFIISAIVIGLVAFVLMGCSSHRIVSMKDAQAVFPATQKPQEYFIQPGDQLDIKFFYNPELNETVSVRPDGKISLQLVDDVQAAGLTPSQLDEYLTNKYAKELRKPVVTVIVISFSGQVVYVGGEVNTPGLIDLSAGMSPLQAVINAGGFRETAMPQGAIVIRKDKDNQQRKISVDKTGQEFPFPGQGIRHIYKENILHCLRRLKERHSRHTQPSGSTVGCGYPVCHDDPYQQSQSCQQHIFYKLSVPPVVNPQGND